MKRWLGLKSRSSSKFQRTIQAISQALSVHDYYENVEEVVLFDGSVDPASRYTENKREVEVCHAHSVVPST